MQRIRPRLRLHPVPLRLRHPPRLILRLTCGCTEKDDDTNRDADKGGGTGIIKKEDGERMKKEPGGAVLFIVRNKLTSTARTICGRGCWSIRPLC